ncbi:MAG: hypothetical protein ACLSUM_06885 [Dysosmobacter welbionis]
MGKLLIVNGSPGALFQLPEVYRTVSSVLGDGGPVYRAEGWTALPRGLYDLLLVFPCTQTAYRRC